MLTVNLFLDLGRENHHHASRFYVNDRLIQFALMGEPGTEKTGNGQIDRLAVGTVTPSSPRYGIVYPGDGSVGQDRIRLGLRCHHFGRVKHQVAGHGLYPACQVD